MKSRDFLAGGYIMACLSINLVNWFFKWIEKPQECEEIKANETKRDGKQVESGIQPGFRRLDQRYPRGLSQGKDADEHEYAKTKWIL